MIAGVEAVALHLFEDRGFNAVRVDDIAATAEISLRTFYRYFPAKEDLVLVLVRRRAASLAEALASRPEDEPPLHSLATAMKDVVSGEDPDYIKRWVTVVASDPVLTRVVLGANIVDLNVTIADFFGRRLGVERDALIPTIWSAAAGAVIQNAQARWHFRGGDLAATISQALQVLEEGIHPFPDNITHKP
jgi:AcrR family transcriptional regulator